MTTPAVEFRLVNNITVTIPVSSLPLIQQVSAFPDRENLLRISKESLENLNSSPQCCPEIEKRSRNCDIVEKSRENCDKNFQEEPKETKKVKLLKKSKGKDDKHQCKICPESFLLISELHKHKLKNHPRQAQDSHQCFFCQGIFEDKSSLLRHILVHGNFEFLECPDCACLFMDIGSFLDHMDNHKGITSREEIQESKIVSDDEEAPLLSPGIDESSLKSIEETPKSPKRMLEWQKRDNKIRPFSCTICNRSFTLASTLSLHKKRTHLGIRPHECPECGWKFAQSSDLTKHIRTHTGDRPYRCEFCGMAFRQLRNLKNHAKMHTEEPSMCKYCQKIFAIDTSLVAHLKKHEGPEAEPCEVCGIPFTQAKDLEHHRRRHHRESRPHKCFSCDKSFGKKCDMIKHQRIHTGEKPFACSICQKSFTHPTSLRNHAAVHSGEKPFQCSTCGRAFAFAGNLKVHMRSHTGERPFECSVCRKTFSRSANLNEHLKIHTGEKSYRCDVCGKAFTNSSTFSKHKKIHSGVRPHSCPLCSKAFIQYAHLAKHLRIHTGEKPYKCPVCGKFFRRTDTLSSHMKTHKKLDHPKDIHTEVLQFTFTAPEGENAEEIPHSQAQDTPFDLITNTNSALLITHL